MSHLRDTAITVTPKRDYPLTDYGNAQRLVAEHGDDLRHVDVWGKWLVWTGTRFATDETGEIVRRAKRTVRDIYQSAADESDSDKRAALSKHARASESVARLKAMIELAKSEHGVAITPDSLDADPWLLNTITGTVDLRTGELRPHDRRDLQTKCCPVGPEDVPTPLYDAFLARIFENNAELIEYWLRFKGYSLTGDIRHHHLLIGYGSGANGKSTDLDLHVWMLGDYAAPAADSLLMARTGDEHPTEVADLCGRRLVVASETEEGRRLRINLVKKITGDAMLKGRYMRQDYFTFNRTHKTVLVTNNRPRITEDSEAVWRRVRLIPFGVRIPDHEQDRALPDKLRDEAPGILHKLVKACLRWQGDRFDLVEPDIVTSATEDYRAEEDPLAEFLDECCIVADGYRVSRGDVWNEYIRWADRQNITAKMGKRTLYDRLRRVSGVSDGWVGDRTDRQRAFEGIGLALG